MINQELSLFENEVFQWLINGDDPVLEALRHQFNSAQVKLREYTGVGLFINLIVQKNNKGVDVLFGVKPNFCFGDVRTFIGIQNQELGFLLWITDGYLDFLEAYTYGDVEWPEDLSNFKISYIRGNRDIQYLRKQWEL